MKIFVKNNKTHHQKKLKIKRRNKKNRSKNSANNDFLPNDYSFISNFYREFTIKK